MAKAYVTRCIVIRKGKQYPIGSVIEDLTKAEIMQGLSQHWLKEIGNDEGPRDMANSGGGSKREKLLAKASEFGLEFEETATNEEIQQAIKEAKQSGGDSKSLDQMSKGELIAKAKELGIDSGFFDSEEKLRQKIREAEAQ